jgi:hypothetical protein
MNYESVISSNITLTYRNDDSDSNNLGALSGVDFDSEKYSGYLYYWTNGYFDFMVYDMVERNEVIPITVVESESYENNEIISKVLEYFKD